MHFRWRIGIAAAASIAVGALAVAPSALSAPPTFKADPHSVRFGRVPVSTTAETTLTITNVSSQTDTGFSVTLVPSTGFAIGGGTCPVGPDKTELDPGESCTVTLSFTPPGTGRFTGQLFFGSNLGPTVVVKLTGTGI